MKRSTRIAIVACTLCAACVTLCLLAACTTNGGNTGGNAAPSGGGEGGFDEGSYSFRDDTLIVSLKSNPTTGFTWTAAQEGAQVAISDDGFTQDKDAGDKTGVGGTQQFTVKAQENGSTTLTFTYARPWEENGDWKTVTLKTTVKDGKFVEVGV